MLNILVKNIKEVESMERDKYFSAEEAINLD